MTDKLGEFQRPRPDRASDLLIEEIGHKLPANVLHDEAQQIDRGRGVSPNCSRFGFNFSREDDLAVRFEVLIRAVIRIEARAHRQHVADQNRFAARLRVAPRWRQISPGRVVERNCLFEFPAAIISHSLATDSTVSDFVLEAMPRLFVSVNHSPASQPWRITTMLLGPPKLLLYCHA